MIRTGRFLSIGAPAAVAFLLAAGLVSAFDLSDHARTACIQPPPKVAEFEAEALDGAQAGSVVADGAAANGKAVRLRDKEQKLRFTLRDVGRSTYSVWCIARSEGQPSEYREPVYVHFCVEGPSVGQGGATMRQWRVRINYMGEMYQDVAHLYFDANAPGNYSITISLGPGSAFPLLVDRLEVRDVLGNTWKHGFKTEATVHTDPPFKKKAPAQVAAAMSPEEALRRARDIAASFPPRNVLLTAGGMVTEGFYHEFELGTEGLSEQNAARWLWRMNEDIEEPWVLSGPKLPVRDEDEEIIALPGEKADGTEAEMAGVGAKVEERVKSVHFFGVLPESGPAFDWGKMRLGETGKYCAEDFDSLVALPGRWPDDGGGYFTPTERSGKIRHNFYFHILAGAFKQRYCSLRQRIAQLADEYYETGDPRVGFRGAAMLAFFADAFPNVDHTVHGTMNVTWGTYPFNCFSGRHAGEFGKFDYSGWEGPNSLPLVHAYDKLFPCIQGNQLLADAVGSVIPWVKTPEDVTELIDVKLLQHFYDVSSRMEIRFDYRSDPIIPFVQGNNKAGRAMLAAIVQKTDCQYPALLDEIETRRSRDSTSFIGSMFYAKGPSLSAGAAVADVTEFGRRYGADEFVLTRQTDMLRQAAQWLIEPYACGIHIPGVGDVSGPEGYPAMVVGDTSEACRVLLNAWKEYKDPRFAWMLLHVYGVPADVAEETVGGLKASAAQVARDPRVNQPSRILGGFGATILEANGGADDLRDRTGLVFRTGSGSGHSHGDQLNIEVFAKGIVALAEFGGRDGYGEPSTTAPQSHCLVTVDGRVAGQGRTSLMADLPGAPCAEGRFVGGPDVRRFVALVEAGDRDAYVFDVVRAGGGKTRTYWFHANQTEAVEYGKDVPTVAPGTGTKAATGVADLQGGIIEKELADEENKPFVWNEFLFSHNLAKEEGGVCDRDVYQAVWPLAREMEQRTLDRVCQLHRFPDGAQPQKLFDPASPRKYTRLVLFGNKGRKVETFTARSIVPVLQYRIPCIGVSEDRPPEEASVFAALIEPFAGKSFLRGFEQLSTSPTATGSPFAAEVRVGADRRDILLESDAPDQTYEARGSVPVRADGTFAFVSYDGQGPRAAALVAGTQLDAGEIGIRMDAPAYEARIRSVDFAGQQIVLDKSLPASLLESSYFLLGRDEQPYRIVRAEPAENGTVLHYEKKARTYRSTLFTVRDHRQVVGLIEPENFQTAGWLTNEAGDKGWPVTGIEIGALHWMGAGFRGGAQMGYPITWDDVPDADGDGVRTLILGPSGDWKEPMRVEVLDVDTRLRVFAFKSLNTPAGYGGTRSYAGGPIVNEAGKRLGTTVMPGKMASFIVSEGTPVNTPDFTDADGDGQVKFSVYFFGPGDTARLTKHAGVVRQKDGTWLVKANAPVEVTLPGTGRVTRRAADGKWQAQEAVAGPKSLRIRLSDAEMAGGTACLRIE